MCDVPRTCEVYADANDLIRFGMKSLVAINQFDKVRGVDPGVSKVGMWYTMSSRTVTNRNRKAGAT